MLIMFWDGQAFMSWPILIQQLVKIYKDSLRELEMKSVVWKLFNGSVDSEVHSDFVKFSRGIFDNRYLVEGKKQTGKWAIKTSAEFANYFVAKCLPVSGRVVVSGAIISTGNLKNDCPFEIEKVKQFQGVKQVVINTEVDVSAIRDLMSKYPRAFFALSFKTADNELKIKAKAPKSGKPSSKGEGGPRADFCSLKTTDKSIIEDLFFDLKEFKEVVVRHTIEISNIEIDTSIKNPAEMRERAVRLGVITRKVVVDGREDVKKKEFGA